KGAEAAYQNAKRTREVADIAFTEYDQGVARQEQAALLGEITLAKAELDLAAERLKPLKDAPKDALARRQAAVDELRARSAPDRASAKRSTREKHTLPRRRTELRMAVERARSDELARQAAWELEKAKEAKLRRMIQLCDVRAPIDGSIQYARPAGPAPQGQPQIEVEATVRERQLLFRVVPNWDWPDEPVK